MFRCSRPLRSLASIFGGLKLRSLSLDGRNGDHNGLDWRAGIAELLHEYRNAHALGPQRLDEAEDVVTLGREHHERQALSGVEDPNDIGAHGLADALDVPAINAG